LAARDVESLAVFPLDPLAFFGRTVLAVDAGDVRRVTLKRDGAEQTVERGDGGAWVARAPAGGMVHAQSVDVDVAMAGRLEAIRIEGRNLSNLAAYGLAEPRTLLTFGLSGGESIQKTILLGFRSKTDGVFAMVQGQDIVFVLAKDEAERLVRDIVAPAGEAKGE
jgi:hypothetical protein